MIEQAKNAQEITVATSDLDQQTREASRAMKEQIDRLQTNYRQFREYRETN